MENAWFKKPRGKLSKAALKRTAMRINSRKPRKGETVFIHTHSNRGLTPTARDIVSFINQMPYGVRTSVIACTDGTRLQGYTVIKPRKNTELQKAYHFMGKLIAEGMPKTIEGDKRRERQIRAALKRYKFNVKIVPMPNFFAQISWKTPRKRTTKQ